MNLKEIGADRMGWIQVAHDTILWRATSSSSSSSYMALQPISGLGLLFMRFRNLTLIDGW
jgi:hypothetical protein